MWIVYLVISIVFYSAAKGAAAGSAGSTVAFLFLMAFFCGVGYFLYFISPYGKMIKSVNPSIEDKYKEHLKHMHSYLSRNVLLLSIAFLVYGLSIRLSSYSKTIEKLGYVYDNDFYSAVIFLIGIFVLLVFVAKYKNLARSEKREIEYMDEETKKRYQEEMQSYFTNLSTNPKLHYVEYKGGHPLLYNNIYMDLQVDGNRLNAVKVYDNSEYFSIFIPDIVDIRHETLYSERDSTSFIDELTSVVKLMYIDYIYEGGTKVTLKFSVGNKKTLDFENRIMDIKYAYEESEKITAVETINDKNEQDITLSPEGLSTASIENPTVEERLTKLKELWDKELINEADYTKRKEEILKEV